MESHAEHPYTSPPYRRHAAPVPAAIISALLVASVAGGFAGAAGARLVQPEIAAAQAASQNGSTSNATLPFAGDAVAAIYDHAKQGVVHITSIQGGGRGGIGSGFVLDQQGRILTNNHVVDGAQKVMVRFADGTEAQAKVLGRDAAGDLALIQVSVPANVLMPLQLGDSDAVRPGQLAVAIGNPLGLDDSITAGVVSATARTQAAEGGRPLRGLIQTDAPINPGNSGGPLLNGRGEVIGLNTLGSQDAQGIGFAIPINAAKALLPRLQNGELIQHAYLGIGGRELTPSLAQQLGVSAQQGVLIVNLAPNGPAARAGLKAAQSSQGGAGGDVILAIDGQQVKQVDDIGRILDSHKPGDTVGVRAQRGGSDSTVQVTLASWPNQG